jgi:hypothetical protein
MFFEMSMGIPYRLGGESGIEVPVADVSLSFLSGAQNTFFNQTKGKQNRKRC